MLTFKGIQDAVLTRFNDAARLQAKEWITYVYGQLWSLDEWTFKQATATVQITAGSTAVPLPGDFGIPHELLNTDGSPLMWKDWREFQMWHVGETGQQLPYDFTVIGAGVGAQMLVGPPSSETALYTLLYERERGFYPSTTLSAMATLPQGTLTVADTSQAPSAGQLLIAGRTVTYTGKTSTTLTGCTGGTGAFSSGETAVFLSPQAGDLSADSDVPMLPPETHQILVHGGMAIGQTGENDYSLYLSDDRVQQGLDAMRRRYLVDQRGGVEQWGSYAYANLETGGGW